MIAEILDVDPDAYHELPGLSSSIAKTLIGKSPLHAWSQHPLLGGKGKKPTKEMDFGQVAHKLILGKGKSFKPLDYDDWRTKDAKRERDEARKAGLVPVLTKDYERAKTVAEKVIAGLADRGIVLDGQSELAVTWFEQSEHGPVQCRAMFDHVWLERGLILDLKITGSAEPSFVERNAENLGYGIQDAAYRRAMRALIPELAGREDLLFCFAESDEPFAMNVCRGDGTFRELGDRRWLRAVAAWAACMKTNRWPAYGQDINRLTAPAWAMAREEYADGNE